MRPMPKGTRCYTLEVIPACSSAADIRVLDTRRHQPACPAACENLAQSPSKHHRAASRPRAVQRLQPQPIYAQTRMKNARRHTQVTHTCSSQPKHKPLPPVASSSAANQCIIPYARNASPAALLPYNSATAATACRTCSLCAAAASPAPHSCCQTSQSAS